MGLTKQQVEIKDCIEMFDAVKKHLGISEIRCSHYSMYNAITCRYKKTITITMYNRLEALYYSVTPTTKNEIPYDYNVKKAWLETITNHKNSSEFSKLNEQQRNNIDLEIYRLKEMLN